MVCFCIRFNGTVLPVGEGYLGMSIITYQDGGLGEESEKRIHFPNEKWLKTGDLIPKWCHVVKMIHVHWEVTGFCLGQMVCNIQYLTLCLGWGGFLFTHLLAKHAKLAGIGPRSFCQSWCKLCLSWCNTTSKNGTCTHPKVPTFRQDASSKSNPANVVAGQVYTCPREPRDFGLVVPPVGPKARNVTNKTWAILHPFQLLGTQKMHPESGSK